MEHHGAEYEVGEAAGGGDTNAFGTELDQNAPVRKMIAKYDYDSRQFSPNVDGGQVSIQGGAKVRQPPSPLLTNVIF